MLGKAGNTAFVLLLFVLAGCGKLSSNAPSIDVVSIDPAPVTGRGPVGSWDSSDVLNPSVVEFGGKLVDYYSGYDGTIWRTGYASSNDNGLTWSKRSKPVLDLGEWDTKYIAANGSAITVGGKVYYYFHGKSSDDHHQIGLAISSDSTTFNMLPKPVVTNGPAGAWDDLLVADPFVVQVGSQYWIYYMAASHDFKFNMGRAVSSDGLTFIKDKEPFLGSGKPGDFDEDGAGSPAFSTRHRFFIWSTWDPPKGTNIRSAGRRLPMARRGRSMAYCSPMLIGLRGRPRSWAIQRCCRLAVTTVLITCGLELERCQILPRR